MADILIALGGEGYFAFPEEELTKLQHAAPDEVVKAVTPQKLSEEIPNARAVLLWQFPVEALQAAAKLQFVMYAADGLGPKRLYPALIQSSVQVTNSRGVRAQAMAEHAIGALLTLSRRLHEARDAQQQKRWLKQELITPPLPDTLYGKTLVVMGVGEIGERVAQIASQGLRMRVFGVRANPEKTSPYIEQMFHPKQLHSALSSAHAVVMALPPTEQTTDLVDAAALSQLAPGAWVINIGRGASLDEDALINAIQSGQLGGAALDVFREEPLAPNSRLWELPQVLITPHSAGVTPDLWPKITQLFGENLHRAKQNQPLLNWVDKVRGY
jgi:D-2-hydroxyacid dehydrogenase (NADP+)